MPGGAYLRNVSTRSQYGGLIINAEGQIRQLGSASAKLTSRRNKKSEQESKKKAECEQDDRRWLLVFFSLSQD